MGKYLGLQIYMLKNRPCGLQVAGMVKTAVEGNAMSFWEPVADLCLALLKQASALDATGVSQLEMKILAPGKKMKAPGSSNISQ